MPSRTIANPGTQVSVSDWTNYIKVNTPLYLTASDVFGNSFNSQTVDSIPRIPANSKANLSDVTDTAFWSPFQ